MILREELFTNFSSIYSYYVTLLAVCSLQCFSWIKFLLWIVLLAKLLIISLHSLLSFFFRSVLSFFISDVITIDAETFLIKYIRFFLCVVLFSWYWCTCLLWQHQHSCVFFCFSLKYFIGKFMFLLVFWILFYDFNVLLCSYYKFFFST